MDQTEARQCAHYNRILADYEAHYGDYWSNVYRKRFLYDPMYQGVNLRGRRILDAMCGSGQVTGDLIERGARICGLDVSDQAIASYHRRYPDCQTRCASLLDSGFPDASFDAIVVLGGLHHLHPHLYRAVDEIHRLLDDGGFFFFGEPHAGSVPDLVRRLWYRLDDVFEDGERAVDVETLEKRNADRFQFLRKKHVGNIAYLAVLNSMVLRIPLPWKAKIAPLLMRVEAIPERLQRKWSSCFVLCQWQKRSPARPRYSTPHSLEEHPHQPGGPLQARFTAGPYPWPPQPTPLERSSARSPRHDLHGPAA